MSNFEDRFKFRLYDKVEKCMVYDFFVGSKGIVIGNYPKDRFILLQSKGLKDINGKLIFEGDIIELEDNNVITKYVIYFDYEYGFLGMTNRDKLLFSFSIGTIQMHKIKVIGNIYENRDLLDQKLWSWIFKD